jgi:hypothetical protein
MNDPVTTTGYQAHAATTGIGAHAATTGIGAHAATTGYRANAATTGIGAHAATTGIGAHTLSAQGAAESVHAVAVGQWIRLTETSCDGVVLPDDSNRYHPYLVSKTDGWTPGVWITMRDGWVQEMPGVLLPDDGRGYQLTFTDGRYIAGCRNFDYAEAVAHWSNPDHPAPRSAALLLAEVVRHGGAS